MNRLAFSIGLGFILLMLTVQYVSASWVPVPNGSFESGTVGLVPDNWVMIANNLTDPPDAPKTATYIHGMQQTDQKYFEGSKSLWLHSRVVDEGLRIGRGSDTFAETEDWINAPSATRIRIYVRDITSTHSLYWGWGNYILLYINNGSIASSPYGAIFAHGEFLNFNYYNYTSTGADGKDWYVYEYPIPESVDKTHMKIEIVCWAWDWTFYDTSYYSDLEFVVDKVELLVTPLPLSASINPLSASITVGNSLTFTSWVSGGTSPYSYQWYLDGNPVSGATSASWTFTSTTSGIYYVHLRVTDAKGNTTQSETARIVVATVPVGGYSYLLERNAKADPLAPYFALVAVSAIAFTAVKRKTKRKAKF